MRDSVDRQPYQEGQENRDSAALTGSATLMSHHSQPRDIFQPIHHIFKNAHFFSIIDVNRFLGAKDTKVQVGSVGEAQIYSKVN